MFTGLFRTSADLLFSYEVCINDLLLCDSRKCLTYVVSHVASRSGLCMYRVLLTFALRMRSCNNALFRFASHIFLSYLVRYMLTSRMQRTHTTLGRF